MVSIILHARLNVKGREGFVQTMASPSSCTCQVVTVVFKSQVKTCDCNSDSAGRISPVCFLFWQLVWTWTFTQSSILVLTLHTCPSVSSNSQIGDNNLSPSGTMLANALRWSLSIRGGEYCYRQALLSTVSTPPETYAILNRPDIL